MIFDRNFITLLKLSAVLQLNLLFVCGSTLALRSAQRYTAILAENEDDRGVEVVRSRLAKAIESRANSIEN